MSIDWTSLSKDILTLLGIIGITYWVPYLVRKGWKDGEFASVRKANEVIRQAFEQGKEFGKKEDKK